VSSGSSTTFEDLIDRFDLAWQRGERPLLQDFLTAPNTDRGPLLLGLVLIDLEHRLASGEAIRVEHYLERFPELATDDVAVIDVIRTEYALRREREPTVSLDEYLTRFPQWADALEPRELPPQLPALFEPGDPTHSAAALEGPPTPDRPVGVLERLGKWAWRRPAAVSLAVSVLTLLVIVGGMAVWAAVLRGKNEELLQINGQLEQANQSLTEQRDLARAEEQKRREALAEVEAILLDGLLRAFGGDRYSPTGGEQEALTKLRAMDNDRLRLRFLERGLSRPDTAERLGRRSQEVIDAVVGQDAERERKVRELLLSRLSDVAEDSRTRLACVHLGRALGDPSPRFVQAAIRLLLRHSSEPQPPDALSEWDVALRGMMEELNVEGAKAALVLTREPVARARNPEAVAVLSSAVVRLVQLVRSDGPTRADVESTADHVLGVLAQTDDADDAEKLAVSLVGLSWLMVPDAAADRGGRAALRLLDVMGSVHDLGALSRLAAAVAGLTGRMEPRTASDLCGRAAAALGGAQGGRPTELVEYARAVRALAPQMEPKSAAQLIDRARTQLLTAVDKVEALDDMEALTNASVILLSRMPPADAGDLAAHVATRTLQKLRHAAPSALRQLTLSSFSPLIENVGGDDATTLAPAVVAVMRRVGDPEVRARLGWTVAVLVRKLNAAEGARLSVAADDVLLDTMVQTNNLNVAMELARAMDVLTGPSAGDVVRMVGRSSARVFGMGGLTETPENGTTFAEAIAVLTRTMKPADGARAASRATDVLLKTLPVVQNPDDQVRMARAVNSLAGRMKPKEAARARALAALSILETLNQTWEDDEDDRLADVFGELAESMDRRDLLVLLQGSGLSRLTTAAVVRKLEPLACSRFERLEEALAWLESTIADAGSR
jgi:hypothetical protein